MRMKRLRSLRLGMTVVAWEGERKLQNANPSGGFFWGKSWRKDVAGAQLTD